MLQNTPPAHLDTVVSSSTTTTGDADEEPTIVSMIDDMSDVASTGTPGPVENATIGGEECNPLGVDVSAPPTGEGDTVEDDVQHGEVSTLTESNSAAADELPPQQQPPSSGTVGVPPITLTALPPASPLSVQPVPPRRSSSFADKSEQGGEELAEAVVMTPSATTRRQETSDEGDMSIFATPDDALPSPSSDTLATEMVELRVELRAQTEVINQKFEKFATMFQEFMEKSNATAATVSAVEERVKIIEQVADKNHRLVVTLDNTVVQIDKKVLELKRDMSSRIGTEEDLQASVKEKIKKMTDAQETLTKCVETDSKNLTTFKREQTGRVGEVKKRMDTL